MFTFEIKSLRDTSCSTASELSYSGLVSRKTEPSPKRCQSRSAARLGNLYWKGDGVEKNIELASQYFEKAAIWQAFSIWTEQHGDHILDPKDTLEFKIWGLTPGQLSMNFTNVEIGPWELPEPLIEKLHWIENLATRDGSKIFEIANHLYNGTGGYEQDRDTAAYWMISSGEYFDNEKAVYLSLVWELEAFSCNQPNRKENFPDCERWLRSAVQSMERAASARNDEAILFMIDFYLENPDQEWADWALYQFLLLAQKEELEFDRTLLDQVSADLSPLEQKVIKTWVADDYEFPIRSFLPLGDSSLEDGVK